MTLKNSSTPYLLHEEMILLLFEMYERIFQQFLGNIIDIEDDDYVHTVCSSSGFASMYITCCASSIQLALA
jgi:hypothetical protein